MDLERDYVFVDDFLAAVRRSVVSSSPPPVVNVSGGAPVGMQTLLDLVYDVVGSGVTVNRHPRRPYDRSSWWLDVSLADSVLGWRPMTSIEDGIRRTWSTVDRALRVSRA